MQARLLNTWNQIAPRAYIRKCYCFPYRNDASLDALEKHLSLALRRLARLYPNLASRVMLQADPEGHLYISSERFSEIPLQVSDERGSFAWTYAQLEAESFPAKAFVDVSYNPPYQLLENQQGIPVFELRARAIDKGLLLCIHSHHSVFDGTGMDNYVRSLAELTRDPTRHLEDQFPTDIDIDLPDNVLKENWPELTSDDFDKLLDLCNEYSLLAVPIGPTQFRMPAIGTLVEDLQKTGRIFVIGSCQINRLKESLGQALPGGRKPSTFTCLAAITWAHVAKARLSSAKSLLSSTDRAVSPDKARLLISVNWRQRAFSSIMSSSAGNTVALPITSVDTATVLAACGHDGEAAQAALRILVRTIDAAVLTVDNRFVALRTALIRAAPDPRYLGVNVDPGDPSDFYFNTWRQSSFQSCWKMPGLNVEKSDGITPDAIRRIQGGWNMGAGLLLPAGKDASQWEVLVTLDIDAMEVLCNDLSWKNWVDKVAE